MSDGKYFTTTKKGEVAEFRDDLRSPEPEARREACKKVIAAMTVGVDVEQLFPDMILCMNTDDVELKKLVYLYIINYARASKDNKETALLAVNTFVKDATGPSPLLRALAVRTMGCLRVEKITEYLLKPLAETLKDQDPYVRKTAALCVAKIYEITPELIEESGFLDTLLEMVSDTNPMVVANAVAALTEIQQTSSSNVFVLTPSLLHKLLTSLPDCTDWGQVLILDAITTYTPEDYQEAETIIDRVVARLQHGNCAVVMSAVRIVLMFLSHARDRDFVKTTIRKLAPPIVTMLSGPREIQYITLRNVSIIVQKRPKVLENQYRVFFCKYNDPLYIKMEKLDVLYKLANERNIEELLNEFKEYATEVDVAFVRKSVNLIGKCAIKLEHSAQKCVDVLVDLIKTEVSYVVQECIVVIRDIYRRYPNKYEDILGLICQSLGDTNLEQEAKAAMVWIVGEYADRIDNADEVLDQLRENIVDDPVSVQMSMLLATVKLFLKDPTDGPKQLVQQMLTFATKQSIHPDLRMRGFVYWRLLSAEPNLARQVILADRPEIGTDTLGHDSALLDVLMTNIASLSSVYHKPPETFVANLADLEEEEDEEEDEEEYEEEDDGPASGALDNAPSFVAPEVADEEEDDDDDILDLLGPEEPKPNSTQAQPGGGGSDDLMDLLGGGGGPAGGMGGGAIAGCPATFEPWVAAQQASGIQVEGKFVRQPGFAGPGLYMYVKVTNVMAGPTSQLDMMLNKNSFGVRTKALSYDGTNAVPSLTPMLSPAAPGMPLQQGASTMFCVAMDTDGGVGAMNPLMLIQVAMKVDNNQPAYFSINLPLYGVFKEEVACAKDAFMKMWQAVPAANETTFMVNSGVGTPEEAQAKLQAANFTFVHSRVDGATTVLYAATQTTNNLWVLLEMPVNGGRAQCKVRLQNKAIQPFVESTMTAIVQGAM